MHIAVVGAGLAGLAVCYHLKKLGNRVTLFDAGDAATASKVGTGLMHPFPGKKGELSIDGFEALAESKALIEEVEHFLGRELALKNGIEKRGELIECGWTVQMDAYVDAFKAFLDVEVREERIQSLDELEIFDRVVLACGASTLSFIDLDVKYVKGQVIEARHPTRNWERSVIGEGHISPLEGGNVQIGGSYEHHYKDAAPCLEDAKAYLAPRISRSICPFEEFEIFKCKAGIRVCGKGSYQPRIGEIGEGIYYFSGLGSRGLLYHAYYGRLLSAMIR